MMWDYRPRFGEIELEEARRITSKCMLTAYSPYSVYIVYSWLMYGY